MGQCRRELISISLGWWVPWVLEQVQFNPDSCLLYCMHMAVWCPPFVLTSKSKSSHTKYFSHTECTLPLSCQSRHPPTDIMELVAELGNLPKTSFLNSKKLIMFVILSDQTVQQAVQCKLKFCTEVQFLDPRYVPSVCWSGSWIKWGLHLPLQEWGLWASKGQEGSKSNYLTTLASILTSDKWTTDWAGQEVFIRSRKKSLKISTIYNYFFFFIW